VREWLETINLHTYSNQLLKCSKIAGKDGVDVLVAIESLGDLGLEHFGVKKVGHRNKMRYFATKELDAQDVSRDFSQHDGDISPVPAIDSSSDEDEPVVVAVEVPISMSHAPKPSASKKVPESHASPKNIAPEKPETASDPESIDLQKTKDFLNAMSLGNLVGRFEEEAVAWSNLILLNPQSLTELGCKIGPRARVMAHLPKSMVPCRAAACVYCDKIRALSL